MPQFAENHLRLEKSYAANQALVPAREVAILENIALGQMFVKMVSFSQESIILYAFNSLVTCGVNSDCDLVPGRSICKQEKNGTRTCQQSSKCSCSDLEFCTLKNRCLKPGRKNK